MEPLIQELTTVNSQMLEVQSKITSAIAGFQNQLTSLQEQDKKIRNAIKESMEAQGRKNFEDDNVAITYIAPTKRTILDTKALKDENPELVAAYSTETKVQGSVRIRIKA